MTINFGLTADDYAKHRAGFPDEFFERVFRENIVKTGDTLADLGTGTGTLARGFAMRGCKVIGLDISAQMLEQASDLSAKQGLDIDYRVAKAEETGLPESTFDVVSAGQCWHWFDGSRAAQEVKRILKPGGRVVIPHFDWLPLNNNIVDITEKLIQKFNAAWYERFGNKLGMYPQWLRDLGEARFQDIQTFSFDLDVPYTPEAWRGRIRASAGVGASLPNAEILQFDSELKGVLDSFGQPILQIPHRVFVVHAQKGNHES